MTNTIPTLQQSSVINRELSSIIIGNPVINGGFELWQRPFTTGTQYTSIADSTTGPDRWGYAKSGAVVHDCIQSTDVPPVAALVPQAPYSLHLDVTTADAAIASTDFSFIYQPIEGFYWLPFAQKQVTVGVWRKETIPGIYCAAIRNASTNQCCIIEYTINAADTWEYKNITFPPSGVVSVANGWNLTNGVGAYLSFALSAGSAIQAAGGSWQAASSVATSNQVNATSSTSNNSKFWGVTISVGPVAAPYWPRPYEQELLLSQRYYWVDVTTSDGGASPFRGTGFASSTVNAYIYPQFPVKMRLNPTVTPVGAASTFSLADGAGATVLNAVPVLSGTPSLFSARVACGVASGLTQFRPISLINNGSGNPYIIYSAEMI